jgi:hypothetical protein
MPKGCISDEVLFEAIALLAMSTGNALPALHTAGRRMDNEGNLEEEAFDAYDEQLGAFSYSISRWGMLTAFRPARCSISSCC